MQFNSVIFLAFFAAVLALHNAGLSWRLRKFNLLWLSYLFYAAWNPPFVVLLWISTVTDWYLGRWLHDTEGTTKRKWILTLSLLVNLGMLAYFKYATFLLESFVAVLQALGIAWVPATPDIVLPIGISFYTFQTLSYTLDIYHRRMKHTESFLDFAVFVSFFPQLVAGPIVRAKDFIPQLENPAPLSRTRLASGEHKAALALFDALGTQYRHYVEIADGGHFVSAEVRAPQIFAETNAFLRATASG